MNKNVYNGAMSIAEAVSYSAELPHLPYNPHPEFVKEAKYRPAQEYKPVHVYDNIYWAGTSAVGSILIDTGEGLIMIDNGSNEQEAISIEKGIRELGLDPKDIVLMIISHEHFDHYAGTPYFLSKVCPQAKLAIGLVGWNLLQTAPTEFAFTEPRPDHADILLTDGMTLHHGNTYIKCIFTPGHSAGCMSFIFNAMYNGKEINVGMMGGSAVWPNYPEIRQYQSSVEYFGLYTDMAECEAGAYVHLRPPVLDQLYAADSEETNPWYYGKDKFNAEYLGIYRHNVERTLASGYIQPYMMPVPPHGKPQPEDDPRLKK